MGLGKRESQNCFRIVRSFFKIRVVTKLIVAPTRAKMHVVKRWSVPILGKVEARVPPAVPAKIGASLKFMTFFFYRFFHVIPV